MTHTLPELFKYIIKHDSERPGMSQRVVPINIAQEVKDWRKRRRLRSLFVVSAEVGQAGE